MERDGLFPPRFKLNPIAGKTGACGWDADAVDAWIAARVASAKPYELGADAR